MKTATESAKALRSFLKKTHGWTSRQISVRSEYFSMGSAINVTIKDPAIPMAPVKAAAEEHADADGRHSFLHCDYSPEANEARSAPYLESVKAAAESLSGEPTGCLHSIAGTAVLLGQGSGGYGIRLWADGQAGMECATPECAARMVANLVDAAEAPAEEPVTVREAIPASGYALRLLR